MSINLNDNIFSASPKLLDAKWGPFPDLATAYASVGKSFRKIGMFAIIAPAGGGSAQLYWYQNDTDNLVPFSGNSSVEVYATFSAFPATGSANVIYIDKSESKSYYWNAALIPPAYVVTTSTIEVYDNSTLFPETGVEGIIYIADDTNTSYIWNPSLNNGNGDYEVISGIIKQVELQSNATHIQWRYVGDPDWINLVALIDLKGDAGQGFTYEGNWESSTTYQPYDVVTYEGSTWITPSESTNEIPGIAGGWYLFTSKGTDGFSVDHISLTSTDGLENTYTAWGDAGETINLGTFVVTDGAQGDPGTPGADGENGSAPDWFFQYAYDPTTVYVAGSIVTYGGETWYALQGLAPGTTPVEGANWTKLAAKGADGVGNQTLQEVLDEANTATNTDISLIGTSKITFDNSSKLKKGTTDSGNGGAGGIALICSLEYEFKWEAGRLYIMQQDGTQIREVRYTFTATPSTSDDVTKGFTIGSRWILDNGNTWICTDSTESAAEWILEVIGGGLSYYTTTGTDGVYTVSSITTYDIGDTYLIKFNVANSGASQLNLTPLVDTKTQINLVAGDIIIDQTHLVVYDGTNFQVLTVGRESEPQIQSDWNQTNYTLLDYIKNKPTIPTTLPPNGTASGDLNGTYPNPTVAKIQGSSVSITAPTTGKILQYTGTEWAPASIPNGGSGGGGEFYFFNYQNTTGISPTTGLPTSPVPPSQLGVTYSTGASTITSANLTQGTYTLVCGFVTIVGTPGITNIPAGLWDFNIWASVTGATGNANQTQFQIRVYKYNSIAETYTSLANSDAIYLYDPTVVAQYIGNVTMPQTTILATDRIYVEFWAQKSVNQNRQIDFYFDSSHPSHVHTTLPSVSGTGLVKVINGVYQTPASTLINADVDAAAAIAVTKLAKGTADQVLCMSTGGSPTIGWGAIDISKTAAVTGKLAVSNGGTGQTTVTDAFNALNPMTTLGDIIYQNATPSAVRLAGNTTTTKKFLSQTGDGTISAAPSWLAVTKTDVGLSAVENTALSTWAGSTNITTLGTIATGTWQGTNIAGTRVVAMVGATGSVAGTQGAVPAPVATDNVKFLKGDGTWTAVTGAGVTTVQTFSGSSQANGASISGVGITFGPADASGPGMVTTGTQTFAGAKTFSSGVAITATSNQLVLTTVGSGTVTINTTSNTTSRVATIPVLAQASTFAFLEQQQIFSGIVSFTGNTTFSNGKLLVLGGGTASASFTYATSASATTFNFPAWGGTKNVAIVDPGTVQTFSGLNSFSGTLSIAAGGIFSIVGPGGGSATLTYPTTASNSTITIPIATSGSDTFALLAAIQTLTNKTLGAFTITDGANITIGTTTGTTIGQASSKLGFFGLGAPVTRQTALTTALTTVTFTAPGTPDYAVAAGVQNTGWGFTTADEFRSIMSVIANLQVRVNELETKLKAYNLLA